MKKTILTTAILLVALTGLWAFQFSPLEQTFSPTGENSIKTYVVVNDSDEPVAVSISLYQRDQDENGNEIRKACNDFQVQPQKVVVMPQSTVMVRVRYTGSPTVSVEKSYRLVAEQIPYSQGKNQTEGVMFNFLYVYATSLYVSPAESKISIDVPQVKPGVDEEGNKVLEVTLRNRGNVHQVLMDAKLVLTSSDGNSITLEGDAIKGIDYFNLLARKTVTRTIPWPEGFEPEGKVTATLRYSQQ